MRILLVEDEDPKRANIRLALATIVPSAVIVDARSVNSALRLLKAELFDLVLLDMSLASFDVGPGEPGGRPQGFGGVEVLRLADRFKLEVPVIVITAYEAFPTGNTQIGLEKLEEELFSAHPKTFRGLVFYNSVLSGWAEKLESLIQGAIRDNANSGR